VGLDCRFPRAEALHFPPVVNRPLSPKELLNPNLAAEELLEHVEINPSRPVVAEKFGERLEALVRPAGELRGGTASDRAGKQGIGHWRLSDRLKVSTTVYSMPVAKLQHCRGNYLSEQPTSTG
jgi:hypothetical protein